MLFPKKNRINEKEYFPMSWKNILLRLFRKYFQGVPCIRYVLLLL